MLDDPPTDRIRRTAAELARNVPGPELAIDRFRLTRTRPGIEPSFASCFDVDTATLTAAALANLAAGVTELDRDRVAAMLSYPVTIDGARLPAWGHLSGSYRTATRGFIQFHCNFPHHADGLVRRLGCEAEPESVQRAVLDWDPDELEARLIADGMIAARMRTLAEWDVHPHARATADLPPITVERIGDGAPRPPPGTGRRLRVLDCSRVLAGPVAGMTLSASGADVLRVGAGRLPTVNGCVVATGFGKRNTDLDLATPEGAEAFGRLLDEADVWIDGYRPGALAGLGFPPERAPPGSVIVQISAFGSPDDHPPGAPDDHPPGAPDDHPPGGSDDRQPGGADDAGLPAPWAGRRGFDSIIQTTTGIVAEGMARSGRAIPTPLPVQANDYCTGLLAAFCARRLVEHQAEVGGTWLARLSLLRTRNWLVGLAPPVDFEPRRVEVPPDALHTVSTDWGNLRAARPIGGSWATPPRPLGTSPPEWAGRDDADPTRG